MPRRIDLRHVDEMNKLLLFYRKRDHLARGKRGTDRSPAAKKRVLIIVVYIPSRVKKRGSTKKENEKNKKREGQVCPTQKKDYDRKKEKKYPKKL